MLTLEIIGLGGFPHSEIVGSKFAHNSPTLIAACHVLHRLCMPRHPPIALTSRLRIHTTIDRPVLRAVCDIRWFGFVRNDRVEDAIVPTQLDNHCCNRHVERIEDPLARTAALFTHAVTASISRTHSQCQKGARKPRIRGRNRETRVFIPGIFVRLMKPLVEPIGIEPMTPCLQSRCSPS